MPQGKEFLQAAKNTIDQAFENYEKMVCNGGLFWPRYPEFTNEIKQETYKSTITNSLFVYTSARYYRLTSDAVYLTRAKQVHDWLYSIKFIGPQGQVFDGAHGTQCTNVDTREYSYNIGQFLLATLELYKATNEAKYQQQAQVLYAHSVKLFVTSGNVIRDSCEPNCRLGLIFHKAIFVKGLVEYHSLATTTEQQQIQLIIKTSFDQMTTNSCNSNFNCGNIWDIASTKTDFHTQLGAMELSNAFFTLEFGGPKLKRDGLGGADTSRDASWSYSPLLLCLVVGFMLVVNK